MALHPSIQTAAVAVLVVSMTILARSVDAFGSGHGCLSRTGGYKFSAAASRKYHLIRPSASLGDDKSRLRVSALADEDTFATINEDEDEEEEDVLLFSDEWEDGVEPPSEATTKQQTTPWKKNARWNSLSPTVKAKIIKEAEERAVRNKKKREPAADKKRRLMMQYKKAQIRKKKDSRITRRVPLTERTPLTDIVPGTELSGTVISLTNFGAYVDVGTECDGLLHVSQISRTDFIEHPRQVLTPGEEVTVRVIRTSPELKKLQLTMLPVEKPEDPDDVSDEDRIPLDDVAVDDELWGEIRRVTAFGGYVELGAEVDGFLHFMDHPEFGIVPGATPSDFMKVGDRIRVWASDVDLDKGRIKLTAKRPANLPGPRREMRRR